MGHYHNHLKCFFSTFRNTTHSTIHCTKYIVLTFFISYLPILSSPWGSCPGMCIKITVCTVAQSTEPNLPLIRGRHLYLSVGVPGYSEDAFILCPPMLVPPTPQWWQGFERLSHICTSTPLLLSLSYCTCSSNEFEWKLISSQLGWTEQFYSPPQGSLRVWVHCCRLRCTHNQGHRWCRRACKKFYSVELCFRS